MGVAATNGIGRRLPEEPGRACARVRGRAAGPLRVAVGRGEEEEARPRSTRRRPRSRRARRRCRTPRPRATRRAATRSRRAPAPTKRKTSRRRRRHRRRWVTRTRPRRSPPRRSRPPRRRRPKAQAAGRSRCKIGVGGRALFRQLRWSDDGGQLAPYTLSPGPEASVWFEAYPAAFVTDGFAANIGLFGRFDYGFGASSKTPAPARR